MSRWRETNEPSTAGPWVLEKWWQAFLASGQGSLNGRCTQTAVRTVLGAEEGM